MRLVNVVNPMLAWDVALTWFIARNRAYIGKQETQRHAEVGEMYLPCVTPITVAVIMHRVPPTERGLYFAPHATHPKTQDG